MLALLFYGLKLAYPSEYTYTDTSFFTSGGRFVAPTTNTITGAATCNTDCVAQAFFVNLV